MAIDPTSAAAAYARVARQSSVGLEARPSPTQSFSELVQQLTRDAVSAGKESEAVTAKAIAGQANVTDVVTALSNAEVALQTVVAVRDRVIQAYQDIMRMPI
jgi:flagellar hook-basal body complex protein FliE